MKKYFPDMLHFGFEGQVALSWLTPPSNAQGQDVAMLQKMSVSLPSWGLCLGCVSSIWMTFLSDSWASFSLRDLFFTWTSTSVYFYKSTSPISWCWTSAMGSVIWSLCFSDTMWRNLCITLVSCSRMLISSPTSLCQCRLDDKEWKSGVRKGGCRCLNRQYF